MENIDLSAFFTTKAEANDFLTRISQLSERVYNTGFNLENELSDKLGLNKKEKFMTLLRDNSVSTSSNSDLKSFFEKINSIITRLPVMSITVAFEPDGTTLRKLTDWFVMNFKRQALFDLRVDPGMIGGAIINFNGKHADFSIKPQFEQVFMRISARNNSPEKNGSQVSETMPQPAVI